MEAKQLHVLYANLSPPLYLAAHCLLCNQQPRVFTRVLLMVARLAQDVRAPLRNELQMYGSLAYYASVLYSVY